MTYLEVLEGARSQMGPYCKACTICNGLACNTSIPGPGAKGLGTGFIRNYQKWQDICVNMDTISENKPINTEFNLFGESFKYPIFAAPVGAMNMHYGEKYTDMQYNELLVSACEQAGILAFTGDGANPAVFESACKAIKNSKGKGIPTVKPWDKNTLYLKIDLAKEAGVKCIAMDIDAAGLPFLKNLTPPAGNKSVLELKEIISYAKLPFIIKGVMTKKAALKALEAGASGIVVSNHGGRVLDQCPSTCEVLPDIVEAVSGKLTIFVDGGIRSGMDIFKALALGADAVLIGRPFVTAIYGSSTEGVDLYVEKLASELVDTMSMCGVHSIQEISNDCIRI